MSEFSHLPEEEAPEESQADFPSPPITPAFVPEETPAQPQADFLSRPITSAFNLDWEKAIYLLFILLALVTRLWAVGDRVVSHDESLHTQYSYQYYNGDGYTHTPLMHGPSLFHATALSFWLFGDSDTSARIPVALIGTLLVVLPYFLRDWLGKWGAITASFLLLISPYITYYSRYIRHDIYIIAAAVITFIAIHYYMRQRRDKYVWWFAAGMGLMFTTMETSFIYVAIFGSFLALRLGARIVTASWFPEALPRLRTPLLVIGAALLLFAAGLIGQKVATRALEEEAATPAASTEEGFAANPDEALAATAEQPAETGTIKLTRWAQIGGLLLLSAGLFLAAVNMRAQLDDYPEFDIVILFTTLTLPAISAFLIVTAGGDPLAYTIKTCELAGQETMSAMQLFLGRALNATCRSAFLSSSVVLSSLFLVLTLVVSLLVGLWWNRRRWLIAAAIYYGIFIVLFTSVFSNPSGLASGLIGSLGYWLEQQAVQRANQPGHFYFIVMPLYEFLPLLFTFAAAYFWARRHRLQKIAVYWLAVVLLAILSRSLANYFFNRDLALGEEINALPGLVLAGLILAAGILFWFLIVSRRLKAGYELASWRGFVSAETLFGFVPYLIWWFLLTWLIYSLAGEKMAWLSTHFVVPMVLLTGWFMNAVLVSANRREVLSRRFALLVGLVALFIIAAAVALGPIILGRLELGAQEVASLQGVGRFLGALILAAIPLYFVLKTGRSLEAGTRKRAWLFAGFALLSLLTIRFTYMANFPNADYVTEYMVYAHGAPATKSEVLPQLEELSTRLYGDKSIKVAFDNDSSWPYTWYLRDYPNRIYFGENPGRNILEAPIIIVGNQNWGKVDPLVGDDYETHDYTFLWWPMEEYRKISWNAIFGDPNVEPEFRRGLAKPEVRQALADIFFFRDYEKYGEVFGGNYSLGQWPLRHPLRLYIRKDSLATIWDHGIDAVAAEPAVDPYAENEIPFEPAQIIGAAGSGEGQLLQPRNLAIGPDGLLFVADSGNHRIQVLDQDGAFVRAWGEFGTGPGQLNEPWGLAVDDEFVYVADTWNHRLQKFTHEGELVGTIGQSGSAADGQTGGGFFFGPRDVLILPDGDLLVTDTGNHRLQILDPDGNFVEAVGSQGAQLGQFFEPVGIGLDQEGELYVADTWNGRIQRFDDSMLALNDWPVDAWFGESIDNKPYLAVDGQNRVYVTDPEGYRVIVFDELGGYLGRFGRYSTESDGFGLPNGIKVDAEGNIYVVDAANSRILKFGPIDTGSFIPPVEG